MSAPRKHFHYSTPYAKPVQKYPSQSEGYISFDMGGQTLPNSATAALSSNEKTPGSYTPKYYQQNYRNSNSKNNRRSLFNNSYGQQNSSRQNYNQNYNQQQHYGPRNERPQFQQQHNSHQKVKNDSPIATYCHPSMTEDPWFELMERIKSLDNSKISIKIMSPPKDNTPPPDTKSNSETDNEEVDSD